MRIASAWVFATALLVACGGTKSSDDASASASTGSSVTGAGGGGGSTAVGAGGAGGSTSSGPLPNALMPFFDGDVWTYKVTKIGAGGVCGEGTFASKVTAGKSLDGKPSFSVTPWCDGVSEAAVYAPGDGNEVFYRFNNAWQLLLDGNVEDGHTWTFQGLTYLWKSVGSQTVNGTKHEGCWGAQRQDGMGLIFDIYCPGIGPLKHHYQVGADGYEAVMQ